ncbi:MAG TPA: hypothetical protein VNZ52_12570 [Candidatus Thermoplasmatota archaeon]|nr:hypothetical protein [Candidatus Thermoplasmatota archaeon]
MALLTLPALLLGPSSALPNGVPAWGPWRTETLSHNAFLYQDTALLIAPGDVPHLLYVDRAPSDKVAVYYSWRAGLAWERVLVADQAWLGDLALDAAGRAHIVHAGSAGLVYATYHAGVLTREVVKASASTFDVSLALDAAGSPHLAYGNFDTDAIEYAYRNPATGAWTVETVPGFYDAGNNQITLRLDSAGRPHVAYDMSSNVNPGVWYAMRGPSGGWTAEELGSVCVYSAALALDAQDRPHIACSHTDLGLTYVTRASPTSLWTYERVDAGFRHGQDPDLVLDAQGRPHLSFAHGYNPGWPDDPTGPGQLHYATRALAGGWAIELVDPVGQYNGIGSSIALDSLGIPHVSYVLGWHRYSEGALDPVLEAFNVMYAEPVVATGLGMMP